MSQVNAAFRKLLEYEARAAGFAPGRSGKAGGGGDWTGVAFSIGGTHLACSIDRVREFLPPPPITRVPGTKRWILGLANVRGELVTIVDLACYLDGIRSPITMRSRLLSASLRGRPVGLLVDEAFGQMSFDGKQSEKPGLEKDSPLVPYVSRQYRSGEDTWQELDLDALFGASEFLNGAAQ